MPQTITRVAGSGFTTFNYRGRPIALLDRIADAGQRTVGVGVEGILTLNARHAIEIVTGRAVDIGTITLSIREMWNRAIWNQLAGLENVGSTITDIYEALAQDPSSVTCQKIIKPPGSNVWRGETYHNCVISAIADGETVTLGDLSVSKNITVAYTHKTPFTTPAAAA